MTETRTEEKGLQPTTTLDHETMLNIIANGDTSKLSSEQKLQYYRARCEAAGLDFRAQPFQFIKLQGKEVLYATKAATDQLSSKHGVLVEIVSQTTDHDVRVVTVRARTKDNRQTDEIGCVSVKGYSGDALCNAYMKAVTKAKRRAILSLCGLGMMDETEVETIPTTTPATQPKAVTTSASVSPALAPAPDAPAGDPGSGLMRVVKITKGKDGRFKAYDEENIPYILKDEAMAKDLRAMVGKQIIYRAEDRQGEFFILSFEEAR